MTHLYDLVAPVDLYMGTHDGLIKVRDHETLPYSIYNYTDRALYTPGAWDNPAVRVCRGLVVHKQRLTVVARPWAKFFNHGQKEAAVIAMHEPVTVLDKLDGSLGIGYLDDLGQPRIATRGSFHSDQAEWATSWMGANKYLSSDPGGWYGFTPLFEIIYPENRIVCDYGDRQELVLLGGVEIETGRAYTPHEAGVRIGWEGAEAETFPASTLGEALALPPRPGKEGVVVMSDMQPQALVKIKQEDYVALHRIVTGLSERSVWERMMAGDMLEDILDGIPDELHKWVSNVYCGLCADQFHLGHDAIAVHEAILRFLGASGCASVSRKDYAEQAKKHTELRPYLFMLLDGKDIWQAVLKSLKPAGDKRPVNRKEDVA